MKTRYLFYSCILLIGSVYAADFYVDPQGGSPENNGTEAAPWKSLQRVFDQHHVASQTWPSLPYKKGMSLVPRNPGGEIKPGDTIWLAPGDYGELNIENFYNAQPITIAAKTGAHPRFRKILIRSSAHWILRGVTVAPSGHIEKGYQLVDLDSHSWRGPVRDITLENMSLSSAADISGWSREDWNKRACSGINADGTRIVIRNNRLLNISFGISVGASHALVENNLVENFSGDGLRGLGDHSVFQSNVVKNCYDVNDNHDDGFQSWSNGPRGVGTGAVRNMVLRGNKIINFEDPNQPHRGPLQGIGCFDGFYEGWVIENNEVVVDHWHGITLMGARNCRIENNRVADPNDQRPGPAAIRISKHKKGMPSTHCVVRGNRAPAVHVSEGEGMIKENNQLTK